MAGIAFSCAKQGGIFSGGHKSLNMSGREKWRSELTPEPFTSEIV